MIIKFKLYIINVNTMENILNIYQTVKLIKNYHALILKIVYPVKYNII